MENDRIMSLLDTLAGVVVTEPQPVVVTTVSPEPASTTSPVHVIPYNATLDPQADAFLPWMWKRMQADDLVDYYFPGQKDTGFATFVRLMSGDAQIALFTVDDPEKQWENTVVGFITWTPSHMGASEVIIAGFIFFRKFWNGQTTDAAAKQAFAHWFKETPAQVVLGVCPSLHATAIRYNKRVGLHEIGRIPKAHVYKDQSCDAILYAITRDEWEGRV